MATGPWANQTEMDRRVNAVTREFEAGGRVVKYSQGGKDPNEMVSYKGKLMKRSQMEAMWAQEDAAPESISEQDVYKKYLNSQDKGHYLNNPVLRDIVRRQQALSGRPAAGAKFAYGGKMKNYASGGKVLRFR